MNPADVAKQIAEVWGRPEALPGLLKGHQDLTARAGREYADAEIARMLTKAKKLARYEKRRGLR